jgi:hypothetical protein
MSHYQKHYQSLHDEALIDIALQADLVPEARSALQRELAARGITDLSRHAAVRGSQAESEERHRRQQVAFRTRVIMWRTRLLYGLAALAFIRGVLLFINFDPSKSTEDGGLLMLGAPLLALFAFASERLSKAWNEQVLLRRPPK